MTAPRIATQQYHPRVYGAAEEVLVLVVGQ